MRLATIALLLLLCSFSGNRENDRLAQGLRAAYIPLATDSNFSGMEKLQDYLSDKRILMLSDGHQSGATKKPLTDWIRFLHERCGYDVVLLESDIYEAELMQRDMHRTPDSLYAFAQKHIVHFISHCEQSKSFFQYAQETQHSTHPLAIHGIDFSLKKGFGINLSFFKAIDSLVGRENPQMYLHDGYQQYLKLVSHCIENIFWEINAHDRDVVRNYTDTIATLFENVPDTTGWWKLMGKNFKRSMNYRFLAAGETINEEDSREAMLWDNLNWLLTHRYAGKKVIVWASALHLFDNTYLTNKPEHQQKTCGYYLRHSSWKNSCALLPGVFPADTTEQGVYEAAIRQNNWTSGILLFSLLNESTRKQLRSCQYNSRWVKGRISDLQEGSVIFPASQNCVWIDP